VVATVPVGDGPEGVAATASRVFVTNVPAGNVSIIAADTNTVEDTVGVGAGPVAVAVGAGPAAIPTMSEWAMILLALTLLTLGVHGSLRRR
jgi:YVTN family beta-propeller protein